MANTVIQLKYSEATSTPASLNVAEPAYSNNSGKLFIGDANETPIVIGGKYYTDIVDGAVSANTFNALVKRDESGNFSASVISADLYGNANTATQLETARWVNINGDVDDSNTSFDGTANVDITLELKNTGVSSGDYGGATQIPTFNVDEDGRITSAANVSISTELNVAADTGTNVISLATDTLTFVGGDGITTSVNPTDNVTFDVDNTVLRTTGNQTISGDISITGNLNVTGNLVSIDVDTLKVDDPLLHLAANNETSDAVDVGFVAHYSDDAGVTKRHTGLFRDTSSADKRYFLFENLVDAGLDDSATTVDTSDASFAIANLQVNLVGGKVSGLSSAIGISDGGTGATSFTASQIIVYNGTSLISLANTGTAATYANASHVPVITTDAYGRVSSVTNTAIAIAASQVTSGTLPIARGGTNNSTYDNGTLLQFDGTSISSLANTGTAGTYANASHVPVITTDDYGRVSSITNTAIAIAASQITSGTLSVARGGTGNTSFNTSGILMGQGTSAITTVESSTEGHVLQINASGVPTFAHLNGGSF